MKFLNCSAVVTASAGWSKLGSPEWLSQIPIVWWLGQLWVSGVPLYGVEVGDLYYLKDVALPTARHTSSILSPSPGVPVAPSISGFVWGPLPSGEGLPRSRSFQGWIITCSFETCTAYHPWEVVAQGVLPWVSPQGCQQAQKQYHIPQSSAIEAGHFLQGQCYGSDHSWAPCYTLPRPWSPSFGAAIFKLTRRWSKAMQGHVWWGGRVINKVKP